MLPRSGTEDRDGTVNTVRMLSVHMGNRILSLLMEGEGLQDLLPSFFGIPPVFLRFMPYIGPENIWTVFTLTSV